jgi:hypothetical protein
MAAPPAPGMGRAGGSGAAFPQSTTPTAGPSSQLIMVFSGETSHIQQYGDYIKAMLDALAKAKYPGTQTPAFSKVEMTGQPHDVWRNAATGEVVKAPTGGAIQGDTELLHFVAFSAYGVVNTKTEAGAPAAPGNKP